MKKKRICTNSTDKRLVLRVTRFLECTSQIFVRIPCVGEWFEPKVPEILLEGNKDGDSDVL